MLNLAAQSICIANLLRKRAQVQRQLDDALAQPGSYSIQGSYSETARSIVEFRDELARLDAQIRALSAGQGDITRSYPTNI